MKADKNLSIKIKSKTERRIMDDPEIEMITEWNLKRIIVAVIVILILIIIPAYYFSHQDDTDSTKNVEMTSIESESTLKKTGDIKKIVSEQAITKISSKEIADKETIAHKSNKIVAAKKTLAKGSGILVSSHSRVEHKDIEIKSRTATKKVLQQNHLHQMAETEPLSPHITHVQLAQGVDKHIPYGQVDLPFLVDDNKARGLYFFTEVTNMQGSTVFHEWLMEDKSIYKRKFNIYGVRWRIHTSKLMSNASIGQWQVRVITQQGKILHKMNFSVEKR